jgi:hypothetical protein
MKIQENEFLSLYGSLGRSSPKIKLTYVGVTIPCKILFKDEKL